MYRDFESGRWGELNLGAIFLPPLAERIESTMAEGDRERRNPTPEADPFERMLGRGRRG